MTRPVISLIIPIYNVEKFLEHTLESVQNQTLRDFEAICVNDGSSDSSADIIKKFAEKDKRFKFLDKKNGGVGSARNLGLKTAKGKYVMFLDGDDYLHPQAMEVAVAVIKREKTDICLFGYKEVQVDENVTMQSVAKDCSAKIYDEPAFDYIKNRTIPQIVVWNKIYKADLAKSQTFYPVHPGEDDIYSLQMLLQIQKIAVIEPVLIFYVQNPQSVMHVISEEKMRENRLVVEKYMSDILKEVVIESNNLKYKGVWQSFGNAERGLLKDLIIRPMQKGISHEELAQKYAQYKERMAQGKAFMSALKLKHKILLWLLDKQYYKLAKILYH